MNEINDPRLGTWEALPTQTVSGAPRETGCPLQGIAGGYVVAFDIFMSPAGQAAFEALQQTALTATNASLRALEVDQPVDTEAPVDTDAGSVDVIESGDPTKQKPKRR